MLTFVLYGSILLSLVCAQVPVSFVDPSKAGGSFLSQVENGLSEPLNVVISGTSTPETLTDAGFLSYVRAVGFTTECLGLHGGSPFTANLGDGNGAQDQIVEYRESFGDLLFGTCIQQLLGGNHFRVYRQNGIEANTSALFLAISVERGLLQNHTIVPDGYDKGRDNFVKMAVGVTSFNGTQYNTTAQTLTGVLPAGSNGINHGIAIDGNAVLLTVTVV